MPTLSEYLLAPWKILTLLASTGVHPVNSTPGGNPAAAGTSVGGLCSVQQVGDQMLSVCNILGYEMPSFVFWASLLIFGMFAISSLMLLFQCSKLAHVFRLIASQLDKSAKTDTLAASRKILARQNATTSAWRRFEEGLITVPETGETFTTQSVDEIFSKAALVDDNVNGAFFSSVPGILTGLGLLMTFVAILDGLSHVSVTANMDVKGIAGLINGLSGKFVSSIVAVTCAVSFVFVERIAYGRAHNGYRLLVSRLGLLFKRRTSEQLLFSLQSQLATQATLQRELAQSLVQLQQQQNLASTEAAHGRR